VSRQDSFIGKGHTGSCVVLGDFGSHLPRSIVPEPDFECSEDKKMGFKIMQDFIGTPPKNLYQEIPTEMDML